MKWQYSKLLSLLVVIMFGCNSPKVENGSVVEEEKVDTTKTLQTELPEKPKPGKAISEKEIILNEALIISSDFYNNLKIQNYSGANKYLHPDALIATPAAQWLDIYRNAQTKTGPLGFVKMNEQAVKCRMNGSNGMGDYAELIFDAQYRDGNLREKLTFFRKDSTESVKIMAYEYDQIVDRMKVSEQFK